MFNRIDVQLHPRSTIAWLILGFSLSPMVLASHLPVGGLGQGLLALLLGIGGWRFARQIGWLSAGDACQRLRVESGLLIATLSNGDEQVLYPLANTRVSHRLILLEARSPSGRRLIVLNTLPGLANTDQAALSALLVWLRLAPPAEDDPDHPEFTHSDGARHGNTIDSLPAGKRS